MSGIKSEQDVFEMILEQVNSRKEAVKTHNEAIKSGFLYLVDRSVGTKEELNGELQAVKDAYKRWLMGRGEQAKRYDMRMAKAGRQLGFNFTFKDKE